MVAESEVMQVSKPLERYREERLLGVSEFASFLGVSEQTYRRILRQPEKVRMPTKRRVLSRLGLDNPWMVNELAPATPAEWGARALAALAEAEQIGVIGTDPETGEPTGEVFSLDGELLRTYDPKTEEPWPSL
jgi:hypothetical protein